MATTHFHEVFRKDIFDYENLPITFLHMQVMFASDTGEFLDEPTEESLTGDVEDDVYRIPPGKKITYLYRQVAFSLAACSIVTLI